MMGGDVGPRITICIPLTSENNPVWSYLLLGDSP
ncbi:hypothetical protein CGSHi22121_05560 [Haemophilus influenzae 22.1-21]|uniref:Uncharacterized protein n=1 Tax=Haemophilus influenzae (strain PittGG) TaxID=374931 RepID=A5UFW2_HAEIG|nr:hypothetical protein CGSHiGG_03385 [Haemophilus influenzae PittGG]EDJ88612.1 hypothetical protein CGSHi22121_05560 [Haemophilus influenzae 22.1-21]EDK11068.1 hypothetical protein CGSHiII_03261 [Haemophilus influenzae PittII]